MKLNGGLSAVVVGVVLTNTIGWGAYITRRQAEMDTKLAVLTQEVEALHGSLRYLLQRLRALPPGSTLQFDSTSPTREGKSHG